MRDGSFKDSHLTQTSARAPRGGFEATVVRVIVALLEEPRPNPTIAEVAERLDMNVRTLQRRLEGGGAPFREILNECRRERALRDLSRKQPAIRVVSLKLGYSDPAHFARAFRRWTGHSPSEYRRRMLHDRAAGSGRAREKRDPS